MRVISAHVHGYKRFRSRQKIDLDGPLIAIVGANEAGKSSLLRALHRVEDRDGFARDEPTRRTSLTAEQEVIKLSFLLDESDREAVAPTVAPGGDQPRWFHLHKYGDGRVLFSMEPRPRPRFESRSEEVSLLTGFLENSPEILAEDESEPALVDPSDVDSVRAGWPDSVTEKLADDLILAIRRIQSALEQQGTEEATAIASRLNEAAERELMQTPHQRAVDILAARRPALLRFSEDSRNLPSEFDLVELEDAPQGLLNLARLGGLDLNLLRGAMQNADTPYITELLRSANERLTVAFGAWNQFAVSVEFERGDGTLLVVHVTTDTKGLSRLDERSEGLQIFVALVAMVGTSRTDVPPIILIDEVELHLHYDAEADLIRFFGEQSAAAQIIYTTHSAGCLPGDLGTGVRVVRRISETVDSEIANQFWTQDQGVRPILYAMGAATLSFIPLRAAVIAEGPSELLLLPSLLREVTGKRVLPFHVTAGAAEARPARIAGLDLEAPQVVYMLDGDDGGSRHEEKLLAAGIPADRVFRVAEVGVVLEDFVDADVYVKAINHTLSRYTEQRFPADGPPASGRPAYVARWCEGLGLPVPGKIQVCHAIVEQRSERPLVESDRLGSLLDLYKRIISGLGLTG